MQTRRRGSYRCQARSACSMLSESTASRTTYSWMTYRLSSTTSSDNQFPSRKQEANSIRHYNLTIKRNWRRTRLRQSTSCHQKLKRISMISRRRVSLLAWRNLVGCCLEMRWELERPSRRLALHIYTDKIGQCLL